MRMKGISLPVNSVIIIALAVMVLLMLAAFFGIGSSPITSSNVENAWNKGCATLKDAYDCNPDKVSTINTGIDIDGDKVPDSLLKVCREKFNDPDVTVYWCRNKCCNVIIREGVTCGEDEDCKTTYTSNWICSSGHCCPPSKTWNDTKGVCD
ncbi:MAG: hypothetical protein DRP10_01845 [Candidatus Aenigmatarchaeota archaeon]|nr:MAG: hypothetical protein DRP10_01845 [Candidatus Aenigmarchaeota archaeon]